MNFIDDLLNSLQNQTDTFNFEATNIDGLIKYFKSVS